MGSQGSPVKSYDYLLKFLLVGDSDVGKGEILDSLQDGSAESPYAYSSGESLLSQLIGTCWLRFCPLVMMTTCSCCVMLAHHKRPEHTSCTLCCVDCGENTLHNEPSDAHNTERSHGSKSGSRDCTCIVVEFVDNFTC